MSDCIFCKIIAGKFPHQRFEDDQVLAFMISGSTGHTLVVPKGTTAIFRNGCCVCSQLLLKVPVVAASWLLKPGYELSLPTAKSLDKRFSIPMSTPRSSLWCRMTWKLTLLPMNWLWQTCPSRWNHQKRQEFLWNLKFTTFAGSAVGSYLLVKNREVITEVLGTTDRVEAIKRCYQNSLQIINQQKKSSRNTKKTSLTNLKS